MRIHQCWRCTALSSQTQKWLIVNCNNAQPERFNSRAKSSEPSELRTSSYWRRLRPSSQPSELTLSWHLWYLDQIWSVRPRIRTSWTSIASPLTGGLGHWQQDFADLCCSAWWKSYIMISSWLHHDWHWEASSHCRNVVTGSADHTLKLWNFYGNVLRTYTGHSSEVLHLGMKRICFESFDLGLGVPFRLTHTVLLYVATGCYMCSNKTSCWCWEMSTSSRKPPH